jgi:hypothetical protein
VEMNPDPSQFIQIRQQLTELEESIKE